VSSVIVGAILAITGTAVPPQPRYSCASAAREVPRVLDALTRDERPLEAADAGWSELIGLGSCVIPELLKDCSRSEQRLAAAAARNHIGAVDREAERENWIGSGLAQLGETAVPAMLQLLASPKATCRGPVLGAVQTVAYRGGASQESLRSLVPFVAAVLDEPSGSRAFRIRAAAALNALPLDGTNVPLGGLVRLLQEQSSDGSYSRQLAAQVLGRIGAAAKEAVPALRLTAHDPDQAVRAAAEDALRRIGETARTVP